MKQVIVGTYTIGFEYVQVVLREGTGGNFYSLPEHGKVPRIKVGGDTDNWAAIVSWLIHEATEFTLFRIGCRFEPSDDMSGDSGNYVFIMNHVQLSDVTARLAIFIVACLPDLSKAWKKWIKEKK